MEKDRFSRENIFPPSTTFFPLELSPGCSYEVVHSRGDQSLKVYPTKQRQHRVYTPYEDSYSRPPCLMWSEIPKNENQTTWHMYRGHEQIGNMEHVDGYAVAKVRDIECAKIDEDTLWMKSRPISVSHLLSQVSQQIAQAPIYRLASSELKRQLVHGIILLAHISDDPELIFSR